MTGKTVYKPQCPQCGGHRIKDKWVEKPEIVTVEPVSLEDWSKRLMKHKDELGMMCGTLDIPRINDYAQLVLTCEDCGFTKTFDVPESYPKQADILIPIDAIEVWCRNGEICKDATPCAQLTCPFKRNKDDRVAGIIQCGAYALTLFAIDWASAYHLPEEAKVLFKT